VANVVLLAALGPKVQGSAADFTVLRLLEDWHYQSVVRQLLKRCDLPLLHVTIAVMTRAVQVRCGGATGRPLASRRWPPAILSRLCAVAARNAVPEYQQSVRR
jgi:hypothetical protein